MTDVITFLALMFLASVAAGVLGALVGIGGGILVTPILTLGFGVPVTYAMGASIISVIGTSCGSACAFIKDRIVNFRVGTLLNAGTSTGAVFGAVLTIYLIETGLRWAIYMVFGGVLLFSCYDLFKRSLKLRKSGGGGRDEQKSALAARLKLEGEYYDDALRRKVTYSPTGIVPGFVVMFVSGMLSGLLGIGSGALNVLGLDREMNVPFKVCTTTSNFMIGVTAAASAGIFFLKGYINLIITGPVAVGVVAGAFLGAKMVMKSRPSSLALIFMLILLVSGLEMIQKGVTLL